MIGHLVLLACLGCGQVESADSQDAIRLQVRRLVRQLDADLLAERAAAEKELVELGPAVLDLLPGVTRNTSAEVKVRLDRVRETLEKAAAAAVAEATHVTLSGEMLLSEVFAAFNEQTGNRIVDFRGRFGQQAKDPTVNVDFDDTPFWQALDSLLDQCGLTVYSFSGEQHALAIVNRGDQQYDRAANATYAGMFRFEGVRIQATRDLRNPENRSLRFALEVNWEPRVAPILLQVPLSDFRLSGGDGQPIEIEQQQTRLEVSVESGISAAELQIPLVLPDRRVEKIASLGGVVSALIPGAVHAFEFKDLENARMVEQTKAGATVMLEQVRKNVDLYEARIRVRFDKAKNALESHRGWVLANEAYLEDAAGKRHDHAGLQFTRQDADQVGVAYLFDYEDELKGCKFVYKTPVAILSLPVSFELQDIPLP